jgi:hypothetical protein
MSGEDRRNDPQHFGPRAKHRRGLHLCTWCERWEELAQVADEGRHEEATQEAQRMIDAGNGPECAAGVRVRARWLEIGWW